MTHRNPIAGLFLLFLLGGCAAAVAPRELVDARSEYARLSSSRAAQLAPVRVHEARQALQRAEDSFYEVGDARATRDLAYVASRRAQIAASESHKVMAQQQTRRAMAAARAAQAAQLSRTTQELSATRRQLDVRSRELTAQSQLSAEQLARERQARAQAEQHAAQAEQTANAALESLRRIANVTEESRGMVITLSGSVLFPSGEATLLPIARTSLETVAQTLADNPGRRITVEGHTDSRGSVQRNQELSYMRAQAVMDFLISRGVPADQIRAEGIGSNRPVADNRSAEGRANNRRVEIILAPVNEVH